jgi:hypothetical protein
MADADQLGWGAVRDWRWRRIVLVAVLVGLPIVGYFSLVPFVDWAIDKKIYKNVAAPVDRELPVTVTSFPSSTNMVSTIGGMGEGLSCSLPWFADHFFAKDASPIRVERRFRQACVFHDMCYRHGLATYGYTQNDCDELLQEQALRICISVSGRKLSDCQTEAKKVAAGVKFGGFKDYRSWDRSTFFEFDPNPYRSIRFFSLRTIDHPFKTKLGDKLRNDPDQLLVMSTILRGGVRITCINCEKREFLPEEFAEAGVSKAYLEPRMNTQMDLGIPSGRFYSGPHIAADAAGQSALVWLTRESIENSVSCVVVADAKKLLINTEPRSGGCYKGANIHLGLGLVDLLSSSPQLSMISPTPSPSTQALPSIVATGLTAQRSRPPGLEVCVSKDMREGHPEKHDPTCHKIKDPNGKTIAGRNQWGAFQTFPIVRGQRHIHLSRTMIVNEDYTNVNTVRALAFDVTHEHMPGNGAPSEIKLLDLKNFDISDKHDPMMPITMKPTDMRLMSIYKQNGMLNLSEIDLGSSAPKLEEIKLSAGTGGGRADVALHESWARRPILILETGTTDVEKKTQLVLSRSKITTLDKQPTTGAVDSAQLEFAILERPAAQGGERTFRLVRGLTCNVTYTVTQVDPFHVCHRAAVPPHDKELATPATRLQGAQLLVGRFASANDAPMLALFDRCFLPPNAAAIVVRPLDIGDTSEPVKLKPPPGNNPKREVECRAIANSKRLAEEL